MAGCVTPAHFGWPHQISANDSNQNEVFHQHQNSVTVHLKPFFMHFLCRSQILILLPDFKYVLFFNHKTFFLFFPRPIPIQMWQQPENLFKWSVAFLSDLSLSLTHFCHWFDETAWDSVTWSGLLCLFHSSFMARQVIFTKCFGIKYIFLCKKVVNCSFFFHVCRSFPIILQHAFLGQDKTWMVNS